MTAQTAPRTLDISGTRRIPFGRLVMVELRKSYDTRASFWLLATIGILVTIVEALVLIITAVNDEHVEFGDFVGAAAFVTSVLLPVLGIMLVTAEWTQRTAMVTFALEPRRPLVIAAKAVVGLILTVATALAATAIGFVCNLLSGLIQGNADWTFGWNFFFGFLIAQSLAMLSGFALAALLLNTAAAIVVFFLYLYALPGLFAILAFYVGWFADIQPWIDFQAAQNPVRDLSLNTGEEWGNLLVSGAVWLGIPLVVGLRRILSAEVK
jgi:ABC-2 type transport system permease protein